MKAILCLLIRHVWENTPETDARLKANPFAPVEQQCSRCERTRHHNGKNAYDEAEWLPGRAL